MNGPYRHSDLHLPGRNEPIPAKMPKYKMKKYLSDVPVGTKFWTIPQVLQVDFNGNCYLTDCEVDEYSSQGGTHQLHVEKILDGVICCLRGDHKFDREAVKTKKFPVLSLQGVIP